MTNDDQVQLFIAILSAHKGVARAISVADMAGRLGFERNKSGQRRAQHIKAEAVERGVLVGSSCGVSHGWYAPETSEEIHATLAQYKARIRSLARLIRRTEGAAGFREFVGQLTMDLEEVER